DDDPGARGDFGFPLAALDLRAQRLIIQGKALAIDPLERFVQLLPGEGSVVDLTVRSHGVAAVVVRGIRGSTSRRPSCQIQRPAAQPVPDQPGAAAWVRWVSRPPGWAAVSSARSARRPPPEPRAS